MASGNDHDRATIFASLPFALVLLPLLGIQAAILGAATFLIGGLWLSPDLDTRSRPLQRWGPLRLIWWPYRHLIPHRSLFSHGPLIGMSLRLLWLFCVMALAWAALSSLPMLQLPPLQMLSAALANSVSTQPQMVLVALIGLEGSVWLHLILDGDPLPAEWHRLRRRQAHHSDRSRAHRKQ
jgi:uncharacterized metal-binding protein